MHKCVKCGKIIDPDKFFYMTNPKTYWCYECGWENMTSLMKKSKNRVETSIVIVQLIIIFIMCLLAFWFLFYE